MKAWKWAALAGLAAVPGGAQAQYRVPTNPPAPAAQLAEMVTIYEAVCLVAFPDDAAAARRAEALGGTAMPAARVRALLHDDPGRGWVFAGRTARFELTIEAPPFHACGVRTMTAAGFPDTAAYRAATARYKAAGHGRFQRAGPLEQRRDGLVIALAGEQAPRAGGGWDSLIEVLTTVDAAQRAPGETGVEVRFTHQLADPR